MNRLVRTLVLPTMLVATVVLFAFAQGDRGRLAATEHDQVGVHAFQARLLSGEHARFPTDYRGKLVLLDFWATWCPPCRAEIPHLLEAYDKFHARGLEILSISLDQAPDRDIRVFTQRHKMRWQHLRDGAEDIASAYGVVGIPAAFLIYGDTGNLLAAGDSLRGDSLLKTIEHHLAQRARLQ